MFLQIASHPRRGLVSSGATQLWGLGPGTFLSLVTNCTRHRQCRLVVQDGRQHIRRGLRCTDAFMELLVDELNHVYMSGAVLWDGNLKQDFLFKAKLFATVCDWPGEPYPVWLTEIRLPVRRSVRAARVRSPWWCEGLLPL